jgi:hypothetical protein
MNINGLSAGDALWSEVDKKVVNAQVRQNRNEKKILAALAGAADAAACANALLQNKPDAEITASCGTAVTLELNQADADALAADFVQLRRKADAAYFGADIRLDFGDPTLGAVKDASGTVLFAGFAFGRRFDADGTGPQLGFNARLGMRHAKLDTVATAEFGAEGGVGFDFSRQMQDSEVSGSAAVEFRYGNAPVAVTDQFQTDYAMFRGSFAVPITGGNSVSVNVGLPFAGHVSPTLSVNFNWGLLLSDKKGT